MNKQLRLNNLLKTGIVFFIYFIYSSILNSVTGIGNGVLPFFIADTLFLFLVVYIYRADIKKALVKLKRFKTFNVIKKVFLSVMIILVFTILCGLIVNIINPDISNYSNSEALISLYSTSKIYTIFKIFIFTTITESILFTLSIDKCCKSEIVFVTISSLIYTLSNFIFTGISNEFFLIQLLTVFFQALLFSYIYVKNKSNIIIYMLIKFFYNIIPFIIVLMGLTS